MNQINKLYLSNFLTGLVFWYGIEKLFMTSIGINAYSLGTITALFIVATMLLDIPGGMLADRWSRKGTLALSTLFLGLCAIVLGNSNGYGLYLAGYLLYALYIVTTEGTYQAIMYDSLHELSIQKQYSKLNGRAHALFLCGAGLANIASGFIAGHFGYRVPFYVSVIPCIINFALILSIKEPKYHKPTQSEAISKQLVRASRALVKIRLLQVLAVVMSLLGIIEYFKSDFGQLYFLRYVSSAQLLGLIWAAYAFTWAIGSFIAHRLHRHLNLLIFASIVPVMLMAFIDSWPAIILFNIQAVASSALFNQIETRIQDETPSHVRASVISTLSTVGRIIAIPSTIAMGWLINTHGAFYTVRAVSIVGLVALLYWLRYSVTTKPTNK